MVRAYYAPKQVYVGTGALATYSFDFKIEATSQLLVVVINTLGVEVQRVRGTDTTYLSSVSITNPPIDGGYVVLAANLPAGYQMALILANDVPAQSYEFSNKTSFSLKRFENALDFIVGPIQRLVLRANQSLRIHDLDDEEVFNAQLPAGIVPDAIISVDPLGTKMIYGPTVTQVVTWKNEAQAAAAAALVSEGNSAASAAASEISRLASEAALASTQAAASAAIININAEEALSIAAINGAEAAALASVAGSTATATAAAIAAAASQSAAASSAAAAALSAASVTPKYQFLATQTLNNNDKITVNALYPMQMVHVQGNAGDITVNLLPFVAPPDSGTLLTIMGMDDAAKVILLHNDVPGGLYLREDEYLGAGQSVSVVYNPTLNRYFKVNRSF